MNCTISRRSRCWSETSWKPKRSSGLLKVVQERKARVCEYKVFVEQVSDSKPFKNQNQNVQNNKQTKNKQTHRPPGSGKATRNPVFSPGGKRLILSTQPDDIPCDLDRDAA